MSDYCDLGPCAAPDGHAGTCAEASGWAQEPKPTRPATPTEQLAKVIATASAESAIADGQTNLLVVAEAVIAHIRDNGGVLPDDLPEVRRVEKRNEQKIIIDTDGAWEPVRDDHTASEIRTKANSRAGDALAWLALAAELRRIADERSAT